MMACLCLYIHVLDLSAVVCGLYRQMAACAAAVLHARLDCIPADIEDCNGLILNLAEDVSFQGRRALAALLPSLHTVWTLVSWQS